MEIKEENVEGAAGAEEEEVAEEEEEERAEHIEMNLLNVRTSIAAAVAHSSDSLL